MRPPSFCRLSAVLRSPSRRFRSFAPVTPWTSPRFRRRRPRSRRLAARASFSPALGALFRLSARFLFRSGGNYAERRFLDRERVHLGRAGSPARTVVSPSCCPQATPATPWAQWPPLMGRILPRSRSANGRRAQASGERPPRTSFAVHLGDGCLETVEGALYRPTIGSGDPRQRPLNAGLL